MHFGPVALSPVIPPLAGSLAWSKDNKMLTCCQSEKFQLTTGNLRLIVTLPESTGSSPVCVTASDGDCGMRVLAMWSTPWNLPLGTPPGRWCSGGELCRIADGESKRRGRGATERGSVSILRGTAHGLTVRPGPGRMRGR